MARFDRAIATADRLITKNGKSVTLRNYLHDLTPEAEPWKPADRPGVIDTTVLAAFFEYADKLVDGTLVRQGDQIALIPGNAYTPTATMPLPNAAMKVIDGSEEWSIVKAKTLKPNGQLVLHELQLRQ